MRKIIHCDADCFFVALEIRDSPDLKGLPVAVGGDPARRGVISTCSYEARAFGVHSAMASAHARRLCPQLIILPHSMEKYREAAVQMRRVFLDYSDNIEPVSLDEAYIDVTATHHCLGSATLIAKDIRRRIKKEVGITVSAGVAVNKFLAKVASEWQKPNGLTVVEPGMIAHFLRRLPVSCLPGVGPCSLRKLHNKNIFNCDDLQQLSETDLIYEFGVFGKRLHQLSRGNDERQVETREYRKSLSVEHTTHNDIVSLEKCYALLSALFDRLNQRLQTVNSKQKIIKCFIKLKLADFTKTTIESSSGELSLDLCKLLLKEVWSRHQKPVRLLGIGVRFSDVTEESIEQLNLFQ
jgi:DNA polymerase-4